MPKHHQKFIIIDANAVLHRSFHALPPLSTKKGMLINAVYGFVTTLLKAMREFKPDYIAVAFDRKAPTFRHDEYEQYKAKRVKAPQEFYDQIPLAHQVLDALRIPVFEMDKYEADDIIGTMAAENEKKDVENIIVTGDMDTLQLIDGHTKVYTLRRGLSDTVTYDESLVKQRYGLVPAQMIDFKAIAGDPSDNIPGVKGIGEKGAIDLLKEHNTLEGIYEAIDKKGDKVKIKPRHLKLLKEQKKEAFMSKKLATIVKNAPVKFKLEDCQVRPYDRDKVFPLFQELEFKSLLGRLPALEQRLELSSKVKEETVTTESTEKSLKTLKVGGKGERYKLVDNDQDFNAFLKDLKKQKAFAVDTESTSIDPFRAELLGISFSWQPQEAYFVYTKGHEAWLKDLKLILENKQIEKYGQNLKYDIAMLRQAGISLAPATFDTMVASYLLNPGTRAHRLDDLVFTEFGHQKIPIESLIGKGKKQLPMDTVPKQKLSDYSCEDADYTYQLYQVFKERLEEQNIYGLFQKMEMPLVPVLEQMEENGFKMDIKFLGSMAKKVGKKIHELETKIYQKAKSKFNINSPLQLKEILFNKLKIDTKGIGKTKTGLSTAAAELEKMVNAHPIIPLIMEYREMTKLQSTYIEALPRLVNPKTDRVHTSFNQTITATGRLSSSEPNLQNIPIRGELGKEVRQAFIAEKGNKIISADYSQIELRIIASLAGDEKMISSFKKGEDIHKRTASEIYEVPIDKVTADMRSGAKEVNFGILYGMGPGGLAERKGITREKARAFIEKYFTVHQSILEYLENTKTLAHEQGFVETLFGRRRLLPEINSSMPQVRAAAERMAVNLPIQGTAADLIKLAMIAIFDKLPKTSPKAKMILQVHDELVFEVPEKEVKQVAKLIAEEMDSVYKLRAPIKTEVASGDNWGDLEDVELKN